MKAIYTEEFKRDAGKVKDKKIQDRIKKMIKIRKEKTVCVVSLGYVGSPLPRALVIENKSV